jgi:hypothetical protein
MIARLRDMIGSKDDGARMPDGRCVRAVPLPWDYRVRFNPRDAWAVLWGRAHAVKWPEPGELERALDQ